MTERFLVVLEAGPASFGAFAPDIPGCVAVGDTLQIVRERFCEAAAAHLAWMAADDDTMPRPVTSAYRPTEEELADFSTYTTEWLSISVPAKAQGTLSAA